MNDNLEFAQRYETALRAERHQLDLWKADFDKKQQLKSLNKKIAGLREELDGLYQHSIALQQEKKTDANFNVIFNYEARLLLNNQTISLIQNEISSLELRKKLIKADNLFFKNQDIKSIQSAIETYKQAIEQLMATELSLKKMVDLLENEQSLLADNALKQPYLQLQRTIMDHLQETSEQQAMLKGVLEKKQQQLKNDYRLARVSQNII
ncbi:hypothetical protein Loa_01845 [Legionella oakridgensis ATCC 33761 = DSM 21215]|uniref:Uncharacterized protein n=1 Tax=Legionella oakridgensis ATCC 33761 = DSM 21215 TaxID=1268635 RepID=W0BFJ6_9GAMM|nr:hypothetical protein [Legionella oakridgensis]AHE67392.1 hypothetical protein Loa_01845 [Legionella oakridgensis ATCC 33761 = DSM 21215]